IATTTPTASNRFIAAIPANRPNRHVRTLLYRQSLTATPVAQCPRSNKHSPPLAASTSMLNVALLFPRSKKTTLTASGSPGVGDRGMKRRWLGIAIAAIVLGGL